MNLEISNKPNSLSIIFKGLIVFCLFMFFTTKPFIKKTLTSTKISVELCEEKERSAEENESDKESDLFETDLLHPINLTSYYSINYEINTLYNLLYINNFNPKVSAPPPELV